MQIDRLRWPAASLTVVAFFFAATGAAQPPDGQLAPPFDPSAPLEPLGPPPPPPPRQPPPPPEAPSALPARSRPTGPCAEASACRDKGLCSPWLKQCIAASDEDCRQSKLCALGRCSARAGRCVVGSATDCLKMPSCQSGLCKLIDGRCIVPPGAESIHNTGTVAVARSRRVARAGTIMTFVGLPVVAIGASIFVAGNKSDDSSFMGTLGADFAKGLGGFVMIAGTACTVTGVVLWSVGASKVERDRVRMSKSQPPAASLLLGSTSATLSYSF